MPAIPYFISDNDKRSNDVRNMFSSFGIGFSEVTTANNKKHIASINNVEPRIIKQIFHNFRTLKPRLISGYRYLFWEIDNQDEQTLNNVMHLYNMLKLPVYVHKSYRGYHFLSVKPIEKLLWNYAIVHLRETNPRFPPVTLRVLANKYKGELDYYKQGFCYYPEDMIHRDTRYLQKYIEQQDIIALEYYYMIVFYRLPNQKQLDNMTIEQRTEFQHEQIANSEDCRI
jgi:lauroyl/myristoyl acyltransferase